MNQKDQFRLSIGLMAASLGLLVVFLGLWLKSAYKEEEQVLQKSTTQAFFTSIMGIQNEAFNELYGRPDLFIWHDSTGKIPPPELFKSDKRILTRHQIQLPRDSNIIISVNATSPAKVIPGDVQGGALSLIVSMVADTLCPDTILSKENNRQVFEIIRDKLHKTMVASAYPVAYKLIKMDGDTFPANTAFLSSKYMDSVTGDSYAVELSEYQPYLMKKILPEILFSVLLLLTISGAFFLVYRSLIQQRRLTDLKNDFINNVTHELKTPITTVGVAIEAMSNFNVLQNPGRTQEYLDISRLELQRLSILVDKVLKMSRFEQGGIDLKPEDLDLKSLVDEILLSMKLQFERHHAKVDFSANALEVRLQGDRTHLTSVVYNLLDNALKYSLESPEIAVSLEEEGELVSLSVSDKGIGIPAEFQGKIFDKFFRAPNGDVHNTKGHGLGLSYVAKVIREHRGQIRVDSSPGSGTRFTIQLPRIYAAG
ncbi:MAG TPA: HAMP domain-containing sensor histidine kinase [Flavilitoribacter sp.]|nr:HAMP domain-containing sensor histidine kinase [Flavilitoribacter sp.]HMQ88763.1 HAMP domain-containing sensor histidine kinase [Flavilitoribacter sp.]